MSEIHFHGTQECSEPGRSTGEPSKVTCPECLGRIEEALERPAEKVSEHRVPADVLARDAEVGQGDLATFRAARLRAALTEVRSCEELLTRRIADDARLLAEATDLSARLTGLIERVSAPQGPAEGTEGVKAPEGRTEALSGFHGFEGNPLVTSAECMAMIEGQLCGLSATAAVHSTVITWGDVGAMYRRLTPEQHGRVPYWTNESLLSAPVNAVDIRTDAGDTEGMTNLSDAAATALLSTTSDRVGASVPLIGNTVAALRELRTAGLIGASHGLTVRGSIERERRANAKLDEAFGS